MKKVAELEGVELDYWVAKAEGLQLEQALLHDGSAYFPSTDWSIGGQIIEREHIWLAEDIGGIWLAVMKPHFWDRASEGPTPLIAAMRCLVASKFGETVGGSVFENCRVENSPDDGFRVE